jgi:hypothetical protein
MCHRARARSAELFDDIRNGIAVAHDQGRLRAGADARYQCCRV